jgi:transcriptional regulator with XRE-family HTH domain
MSDRDIQALVQKVRRRKRIPSPTEARAIRIASGLRQLDLAQVLGVNRVTITRYETGGRRPRGDLGQRYARLLEALRRV